MPYIAYIDPIDACHLKCPTCIRGARGMKNTSGKAPLDLFKSLAEKAKSEGYEGIGIYSWSEPFLNLTLHEYVQAVHDLGVRSEISTTLSIRRIPNLERVLCAGLSDMVVSISGSDQEMYQRNHAGATLDYVYDNLLLAREIIDRNKLSTNIRLRFLRFHYNASAESILKEKADALGFIFEPVDAGGNPDLGPQQMLYQTKEYFQSKVAEGVQKTSDQDGAQVCPLIFDQLAINPAGDAHLCCAFPNVDELKIGPYLEMSESELLLKRVNHPFCKTCWIPPRAANQSDRDRLSTASATG